MATELKGASQLRYALKNFEPDLAKELQIEMKSILQPLIQKARGFVQSTPPLSHWNAETKSGKFPLYNAALIKRGIGYRTTPTKPNRRGFAYAASIHNKTASGAIFETAGRKNPGGMQKAPAGTPRTNHDFSHSNNPQAGTQFISALDNVSQLKQGNVRGQGSGRRGRYMVGRLIYRAWAEDQGKAYAAVTKSLERAANKFRAKVNN
jgi:hypothetical protein